MRHELRLSYSAMVSTLTQDGKRRIDIKRKAVWIVIAVALHLIALVMVAAMPALDDGARAKLGFGVTLAIVTIFSFMLASALRSSVEALFERGDLDLLLSSPISSHSVFTVRLAAMTVMNTSIYLLFLAPLAHAGLVFGRWRLLAVYPVLLSMGALAASLAMLITLLLVRWFGVRVARVSAQVLGALFGAALFLGTQMMRTAVAAPFKRALADFTARLGPDSVAWIPAHAALGEPLPLLAVSLVAVAAFFVTAYLTHSVFVNGVQQAAGAERVAKAPAGAPRMHFGRGLTHALVLKEWRLIRRDPQLISQVLLQMLYMLPICIPLFAQTGASLPSIGAVLTFLCSSLSSSLTWIVVSAEDAPDLLLAAPIRPAAVRRAKLVAVVAPVLALVALPLTWTGARAPLAGVILALLVGAACISAASIGSWFARPSARGAFRSRGRGNGIAAGMFDLLTTVAWSATAFMLLLGTGEPHWSRPLLTGAAISTVCALVLLAGARQWRAG